MVEGGEIFYKQIQKMSEYEDFKTAISRLPENTLNQKGNEELVLRFFAVKNYLDGYHGNVQEWLDSYMEKILFRELEFNIRKERDAFEKCFTLLSKKFGGDAFARHRDGHPQGRLAPAYFEAVVGALLENMETVEKKSPKFLKDGLAQVFQSDAFRGVTGPGANSIEKLHERIQLVPTFFGGR